MEDIDIIHKNDFGIAFWWKRCAIEHYKKINVVFDKIALHLNEPELLIFAKQIDNSVHRLIQNMHKNYSENQILVETPIEQLSFMMDYEDLTHLYNLVEGTLFELGIESVIDNDNRIINN